MSLFAPDGSFRIALDTEGDSNQEYSGGHGVYSKSGGFRVNTTDPGPGRYAADGAYRGVLSDDEEDPAPGYGPYTPDGAWRLTTSGSAFYNHPGTYARDGSSKATIINIDEEEET